MLLNVLAVIQHYTQQRSKTVLGNFLILAIVNKHLSNKYRAEDHCDW
jgi:hypothetical protein